MNVVKKNQLNRDRLFFHDLVNQTHGLLLYLNTRKKNQMSISPGEVEMLEQEIRTLQALIKDHFHFEHKNLENCDEWVNVHFCELTLKTLIQNYLSNTEVILEVSSLENSGRIYFPAFYRIVNNMIKNIAEANAAKVFISVKCTDEFLHLETRNKLPDEKYRSLSLGQGLVSIELLVRDNGGRFQYNISEGEWVNKVELPFLESAGLKKSA